MIHFRLSADGSGYAHATHPNEIDLDAILKRIAEDGKVAVVVSVATAGVYDDKVSFLLIHGDFLRKFDSAFDSADEVEVAEEPLSEEWGSDKVELRGHTLSLKLGRVKVLEDVDLDKIGEEILAAREAANKLWIVIHSF